MFIPAGYLTEHILYWDDKEKEGDKHTDVKPDQLALAKTITREKNKPWSFTLIVGLSRNCRLYCFWLG